MHRFFLQLLASDQLAKVLSQTTSRECRLLAVLLITVLSLISLLIAYRWKKIEIHA